MTTVVLDASAVLALLFGEAGSDAVRPRVRGGLISAVNLTEVLTKLIDKGVPAEDAAQAIDLLGMEVVPFTTAQARSSAALRHGTRVAGLSLGDRACLALARERGIAALTAERRWPDLAEAVGVTIEAIR
jgi:PIN domain nuclease of toxin-antitoxin system